MKVWLYARLSRDEDSEMNSLNNQRKILIEYAEKNNFTVIGQSWDDNISGMHFNRPGIDEIYNAVENKSIDAVVVKDLSRLGRHRTQTAMFIDYLRQNEVRVLSVTENIDTSNEEDDLMVGFKGILNDMYARDIAKKIRAGFHQKQKDGLVLTPPLGYFKDKNTNQVVIVEENAEIVRRIFNLYVSGYGLKSIAKILNAEGIKSPGYYQKQLIGKRLGYNKPEIAHRYLWENTAVKRVLQNEFYAGTLICHQTYTSRINKVRKKLPTEEQYRHENAVPAIVSREVWEQAQFLLNQKQERNIRAAPGKTVHRYAGLVFCEDCGSNCICRTRRWRTKPPRFEYTCNGYHRYGRENCTPHTVHEEILDRLIYQELLEMKRVAKYLFEECDKNLQKWMAHKPTFDTKILNIKEKLSQRKADQQGILLERIRDKEHSDVYTQMLKVCEADIRKYETQIVELENIDATVKNRKKEIKKSIDLIDEIIANEAISDSNIRLLVEKILVKENEGKISVKIILNGEFRARLNYFDEDGIITEECSETWYYGLDCDNSYTAPNLIPK